MLGRVFTHIGKGSIILNSLRNTKSIMYGARAMNMQLPFMFYKQTDDYDIYSQRPKRSAVRLERILDSSAGGDFYYVKRAIHKGTWKVIDSGYDNIKGTRDDFGIIDITRPGRRLRTVRIDGIKYVHLSERVKDAKRSLKNPIYYFRHEKDRKDLWRIRQGRKLRRLFRW